METRTLAQLRTDLRFISDTQSLTDRHPDADLSRLINQSIRALRVLLTEAGGRLYTKTTGALTLTGTPVVNESYSVVPWPTDAVSITGVDVMTTNIAPVLWQACRPVSFGQRRNRQATYLPGNVNTPVEFCILSIPQGSGSTTVPGSIALFPSASSGFYQLWYLPDFIELSADTDVFVGPPDAVQWVLQDCTLLLSERDDDQRQTSQLAAAKKQECQLRLFEGVQQTQLAGPYRPRRAAKGRFPYRA